ncbi:MAG TPA: SCO family protein [Pyrinomonadaceae bacterium]|nr:SCO family protein [Pyrinomonadaceae bacterium]
MKKVLTRNKVNGGRGRDAAQLYVRVRANRFARRIACLLLLTAYCLPLIAFGQYAQPPQRSVSSNEVPSVLRDIGIEQRLNEQVPLDLTFRDETGQNVRLGDYFGKRPVVISLVYYNCPKLCNLVLNGLVGGLKTLPYTVGKEFDVVTVSFDPRETAADATAKKQVVFHDYGRATDAATFNAGWHFLTGDKAAIDALAAAVGFKYAFDTATNQFAHASGVMLTTPEGKLSRYFYGIEYAPRDLKFGLIEASQGKVGSAVDKLTLYCFHYDPTTGKYGPAIMNIMRLTGVVTVVGLAILIFILQRRRRHGDGDGDGEPKGRPGVSTGEAGGIA